MKNILIIALPTFFLSTLSFADNNIPSFNSKASSCSKTKVQNLKSNPETMKLAAIDHGIELSSDCQTIFVHPPLFGEIEVDSIAESATIRMCPSFHSNMDIMNILAEHSAKFNRSQQFARADEMQVRQARVYREMLNRGQLSVVATLRMVMSLRWNELVEAYQLNNPELDVVKLPVYHSLLASSTEDLRNSPTSELQLPPLIYSYVPDYTENLDGQGPLGAKTFGYEFDGTKGAQIGLSYSGICHLYDAKKQEIKKDAWEKLSTYIVSNVTYFYPVKVSYGYKATIDTEAFVEAFNTFALKLPNANGIVLLKHNEYKNFVDRLKASGTISIKLSDSSLKNYTAQEVSQIETDVYTQYVNFIIGHISETSTGGEKNGKVDFAQRTYQIDLSKVQDKIRRVDTYFSKSLDHTQELLLAGSFTFKSKKIVEEEAAKNGGAK